MKPQNRARASGTPGSATIRTRLEQFTSTRDLRVLRILDFQPRRRDAVGLISALGPFADDALEIISTRGREQHRTAFPKIIDVEQSRLHTRVRHDAPQPSLALYKRSVSQVFTVDREQIERVEVRPLPTKQQVVEVAPTVAVQADDLAVEDGRSSAHAVRDLRCELRELCERVTAAGDEPAVVAIHVRERAKAVVFQFEPPIGMVERLGDADERHRAIVHRVSLTQRNGAHLFPPRITRGAKGVQG